MRARTKENSENENIVVKGVNEQNNESVDVLEEARDFWKDLVNFVKYGVGVVEA